MKKLIMLMGVLTGLLFANNVVTGTFEKAGENSHQSIMKDVKDKKVFFMYMYSSDATSLNAGALSDAKNRLKRIFCSKPEGRALVESGYEFIITYLYANKVVVNAVINSCR